MRLIGDLIKVGIERCLRKRLNPNCKDCIYEILFIFYVLSEGFILFTQKKKNWQKKALAYSKLTFQHIFPRMVSSIRPLIMSDLTDLFWEIAI